MFNPFTYKNHTTTAILVTHCNQEKRITFCKNFEFSLGSQDWPRIEETEDLTRFDTTSHLYKHLNIYIYIVLK